MHLHTHPSSSLTFTHTHARRLLPCNPPSTPHPTSGLPLSEASPLHARKQWSSATALGLLRNQGRLFHSSLNLGSEGLPAGVEGVVGPSLGSEPRWSGQDCSCFGGAQATERWALAEQGVKRNKGGRLKQDPCLSSGPSRTSPGTAGQEQNATPVRPHGVPHCPPLLAVYPGAAPECHSKASAPHILPSFSVCGSHFSCTALIPAPPKAQHTTGPAVSLGRATPCQDTCPVPLPSPAQPPCTHPDPDDSLTSVAQQGLLLEDRSLICSLLTSRNQI